MTNLLVLAQSEEGKLPVTREAIDVAGLVDTTWAPHAEHARRKKVEFNADLPDRWQLHTDRALLRHILSNLFSNAIEHAPMGGRIRVKATARASDFEFSVTNPTHNLTADDLPHLFERFWRKDPARTNGNHAGLGLTFAQSVATVLGLTLGADLPEPNSLRVTLSGSTKSSS